MTLCTKCFSSISHKDDGVRISVVSNHLMSDGTNDPRILENSFDVHYPFLAPSPELLRGLKAGMTRIAFERNYALHLRKEPETHGAMVKIGQLALYENVTLLSHEGEVPMMYSWVIARTIKNLTPLVRIEHN